MTYHTVLKTSTDYIDALRQAREIGANITKTLVHMNLSDFGGQGGSDSLMAVFPYRCAPLETGGISRQKTVASWIEIALFDRRLDRGSSFWQKTCQLDKDNISQNKIVTNWIDLALLGRRLFDSAVYN